MSNNTMEDDIDNLEYEKVPSDISDDDDDDMSDDDESVLRIVKSRKSRNSTLTQSNSSLSNINNNNNNNNDSNKKSNKKKVYNSHNINRNYNNNNHNNNSTAAPVVDDFIRNFLIKHRMLKTLEMFQTEWYEMEQNGTNISKEEKVPDIYGRIQELEAEIHLMKKELAEKADIAEKAKATWDKFRKQRDYHRMHHRRVIQEKNKLITDLKRLRKHYSKYEPTIKELKKRYENATKDKMLLTLDNERLRSRIFEVDGEDSPLLKNRVSNDGRPNYRQDTFASREKRNDLNISDDDENDTMESDSPIPPDYRNNPYTNTQYQPVPAENFRQLQNLEAHDMAIAGLALHPTKLVAVTGSDDRKWKLWSLTQGDLIMTGDGHRDWIGGCAFHPSGSQLATASGDKTVKFWDLTNACCSHTFTDHTQAVWDVCFHDCGDFLISGSLDHTVRLWDLNSLRCRQTFRGHVDSVNKVCFQPFTNNICTASGDKTISIWDMRSGLCVQTYYGHNNAVNHVEFSLAGDIIVSSDADGVVKLWDVRMVSESAHIQTNDKHISVNQTVFDRSGQRLACALDDGIIQIYDGQGQFLGSFNAHQGGTQTVLFDPTGQILVSTGSDCQLKVWGL